MSAKTKKSIDQRAPQMGYEGIKCLQSLAINNYLVTRELLSLVESYNNFKYYFRVVEKQFEKRRK